LYGDIGLAQKVFARWRHESLKNVKRPHRCLCCAAGVVDLQCSSFAHSVVVATMKKRTIWTILALMLIGLLGIVVVQVYWLARASELEQSLFKQRVHRALNNVARQLEIRETKALIMQSLNDVRKTAEAAKMRRTMPGSHKSAPVQFAQTESPQPTTETRAKNEKISNEKIPATAPLATTKKPITTKVVRDSSSVVLNKAASDADKSSSPKNNKNPFLSVQDGSSSFEMSIVDGNVSFNSSRGRSSSGERSASSSERSSTFTSPAAPNPPTARTAPLTPPQGLVVTIPTADGQPPFRFFIPSTKPFKRDSIVQRFRRANGATVYSASGSKTLEEKINAAERSMENPTSGRGSSGGDREGMSLRDGERTTPQGAQRDAQREMQRFNERQLRAHLQHEFAKSQQQIERLRRLQGVNTRDLDSLFNMAFRQTWQDMASFGMEMRMMPFGNPMNPPPAPPQPTGEVDAPTAPQKASVATKKNSATQQHKTEQTVAANKQKETHGQSSTESASPARDTISKIIDKIDLIGDILENMSNRKHSALERISLTDLETLLAAELRENAVNSRYEYGIMHGANTRDGKKQDSMVIVRTSTANNTPPATPHVSTALRTSEFQVQLFPNDILGNEEKDYLAVHFPDQTQGLTLAGIAPVLGSSALFLLLIMGCFGFTLLALMKQKKLSDMKTDFINNMTHELKTPIATISIASEALKDDHVRSESVRVERFVNIIHDENKRLAGHVEKVLQAAQMDRGELNLKFVPTDAHELIETVADSLALQLEQKQGRIELRLEAHTPILQADEAHFRNVLVNLLDNANKYSPDTPQIIVSTRNTAQALVLTIQDNGIGMTREAQKQIFEKFYRVPTGNRHDVKGFGLGLNYVKTIVEAHGGTVSVKSEQGKGSTFEVTMSLSARGFIAS
jgi:signal transduction histidine kinase